jgi:hypothetical protein
MREHDASNLPEILAVHPGKLTPGSLRRFTRFFERLKKEDWRAGIVELQRKAPAPAPERVSDPLPPPAPAANRVDSLDIRLAPAVPEDSRVMPNDLMPPPDPASVSAPAPAPETPKKTKNKTTK